MGETLDIVPIKYAYLNFDEGSELEPGDKRGVVRDFSGRGLAQLLQRDSSIQLARVAMCLEANSPRGKELKRDKEIQDLCAFALLRGLAYFEFSDGEEPQYTYKLISHFEVKQEPIESS